MAQNYKIFINEIPIIIVEGNSLNGLLHEELNPVYFFTQKTEIQKAFEFAQAGNYFKSLTIICEDAKAMKKQLFAQYRTIKAAGGCIFNTKKEILMILRHGMWDLPKGKIEKGEKKKKAAIREVREETGIEKVEIINKLMKTYHTYAAAEDQKILKVTHWYYMQSYEDTNLIPQLEEGIETVAWIDEEHLDDKLKYTYGSIKNVVDAAIVASHLS
ncbi:MAG: NUDIX domain-containing protein [Fimbriimonadaceae bacterium]|nr:NUDIX domain-containing protein [Chitinophagales bacterium]